MNFENESATPNTSGDIRCFILNFSFFVTSGDPIAQIPICIINSLTAVTATLANLLVIISIWRSPASTRSPSNVLLAGLASSDLTVGLVVQPIFLVYGISKIRGLGELQCRSSFILNVAGLCLSGVSITILTVITLDRYIAICLHLRYREIVTTERVTAVIVSIWTVMIVYTLTCVILWFNSSPDSSLVEHLVAALLIALNLTITSFTYVKIYCVVRRHRAQILSQLRVQQWQQDGPHSRNMPQLIKSSWNTFLISFTFGLCCLPYLAISFVMQRARTSSLTNSVYDASFLLVFINSTINPALYCWRFKQIRNAVIQTVKAIFRRDSNESI